MSNIEKKILNFIENNRYKIFIICICLLGIIIRIQFRQFESRDFNYYLKPWYNCFEEYGIVNGMQKVKSDYNVVYIYILAILTKMPFNVLTKIKLVSIIFDFIAAIFSYKIVNKITKEHEFNKILSLLAFSGIIINPTTIMNGAVWAQCDIIYVTFILISLYYIINEKYTKSFLYFGISLAFKLQAIFVLPLFIILYIKNREFSIKKFFIIPLVQIVIFLPACFMGRPISDLWNIYLGQAKHYKRLTLNFPSMYCFLPNKYELFSKPGIIFTVICVGIIMFFTIYNKEKLSNEKIIELLIVLLLVETYFLPSMHERYLFCGDILAILYVIIKRTNILSALGILIISSSTYFKYLFKSEILPLNYLAIIQMIIVIIFVFRFMTNNKLFENSYRKNA